MSSKIFCLDLMVLSEGGKNLSDLANAKETNRHKDRDKQTDTKTQTDRDPSVCPLISVCLCKCSCDSAAHKPALLRI